MLDGLRVRSGPTKMASGSDKSSQSGSISQRARTKTSWRPPLSGSQSWDPSGDQTLPGRGTPAGDSKRTSRSEAQSVAVVPQAVHRHAVFQLRVRRVLDIEPEVPDWAVK